MFGPRNSAHAFWHTYFFVWVSHRQTNIPTYIYVTGSAKRYVVALTMIFLYTVFARSVAAATNVFNLSRREATIQERLLFESGVYLFDCALPQELNDYVMVFVNV